MCSSDLMTVGRRVILVPSAILLTLLSGGLQVLSIRWNGGLTGIAAASSTAYLVSGGILLSLAGASMSLDLKRVAAMVARCLMPTVIAFLSLLTVEHFVLGRVMGEGWGMVLRLGAGMFAFGAAYLVLVTPFARGVGLRDLAIEANLPVLAKLARRTSRDLEDMTK